MTQERRIVGFHQDESGDWVADLECGHRQHVRHDPPWTERRWAATPEARAQALGRPLRCLACERGVELVAVQPDDFDALAEIRVEAMRESLERIGRFDPERARARLRAGFSPEHTRHIVVDGERVGFLVLKPQADALVLDHLYVRPAAQGRGIGGAVLAQVFAEADARSLPIRVGALRESDSNRFYVRHGFQLVERAELDNYYVRPACGEAAEP